MAQWFYGCSSHLPSPNPRALSVKLQGNNVSPSERCAAVVKPREDVAPPTQNSGTILVRHRTQNFIILRGTILSFSATSSDQKRLRLTLLRIHRKKMCPSTIVFVISTSGAGKNNPAGGGNKLRERRANCMKRAYRACELHQQQISQSSRCIPIGPRMSHSPPGSFMGPEDVFPQ